MFYLFTPLKTETDCQKQQSFKFSAPIFMLILDNFYPKGHGCFIHKKDFFIFKIS